MFKIVLHRAKILCFIFFFFRSWYRILHLIYKEDGVVKGLYRGMSINYIRAMPMMAMSFTVYELVKQMLGLDTGVVS